MVDVLDRAPLGRPRVHAEPRSSVSFIDPPSIDTPMVLLCPQSGTSLSAPSCLSHFAGAASHRIARGPNLPDMRLFFGAQAREPRPDFSVWHRAVNAPSGPPKKGTCDYPRSGLLSYTGLIAQQQSRRDNQKTDQHTKNCQLICGSRSVTSCGHRAHLDKTS